MDFKEIVSTTTQYNFHSHTHYCDGKADMTTMALAALREGMLHYGFTPHSPIPIASPCNMAREDVELFLEEVRQIKANPHFAACRFYAGMEVDYLSPQWGPTNEYFKSLPLDYIIGSVHFIPTQQGELVDIDGRFENFKRRMSDHFCNDIEYVVDSFYRQTLEMISLGGFDILGHYDKIGQNASYYSPGIEDSEFYRSRLSAVTDAIIAKGLTVELNTKARQEHGRFFPCDHELKRLKDAGICILVNSDSHHPDRISSSRAEAKELLDSL